MHGWAGTLNKKQNDHNDNFSLLCRLIARCPSAFPFLARYWYSSMRYHGSLGVGAAVVVAATVLLFMLAQHRERVDHRGSSNASSGTEGVAAVARADGALDLADYPCVLEIDYAQMSVTPRPVRAVPDAGHAAAACTLYLVLDPRGPTRVRAAGPHRAAGLRGSAGRVEHGVRSPPRVCDHVDQRVRVAALVPPLCLHPPGQGQRRGQGELAALPRPQEELERHRRSPAAPCHAPGVLRARRPLCGL